MPDPFQAALTMKYSSLLWLEYFISSMTTQNFVEIRLRTINNLYQEYPSWPDYVAEVR